MLISLLLSEGVPIQIAQQRAGHQDPKITLSVYSHVSKDKESLVADMLEDVLFSAVGELSRQVNILCFCVCETKNSEIPCAPLGKRRNSK